MDFFREQNQAAVFQSASLCLVEIRIKISALQSKVSD